MQGIIALLEPFVLISLFRLRPQDLPSSQPLLRLLVGAVCVLSFAMEWYLHGPAIALGSVITTVGVLIALTYFILSSCRLGYRVPQTLTALFGADLVVSLVALPMIFMLGPIDPNSGQAELATPIGALIQIMLLLLIGWNLLIYAHVLRHAFDVQFAVGALVAILYMVVTWTTRHQVLLLLS